jgi:hypothetical protein
MQSAAARRSSSGSTRTAAVAVEMWKSRPLVFGAISKRGGKRGKVRLSLRPRDRRGPDFSTLSTARHFHSDYPPLFPIRCCGLGRGQILRGLWLVLTMIEKLLPVRW